MRDLKALSLLYLILQILQACHGYDILFLAPLGSKSHKNFYNGIIHALADAGHKVTVYSNYVTAKNDPNIEDVIVQDYSLEQNMPNVFKESGLKPVFNLLKFAPDVCAGTLGSKESKALFQRKFDLVITSLFFTDCYFPRISQLGVPFVGIMPAGLIGTMSELMGNPMYPSFAPDVILGMQYPLTFFERFTSAISTVIMTKVMSKYLDYKLESKCLEAGECNPDGPSIFDSRNNISAMIINSIRTMDMPSRPYMPNIIHAGGIHLKEAKPLPEDLKKWADDSGEAGFIFFSLGSAAKPSDMPENHRQTLIKVFGSLKQRVLWKWDQDDMEDLPSNVKIGKWLPQQDLLGHPKLQLFITHGGLHSTQESMYHGIKAIGMPLFADQNTNMQGVKNLGLGKILQWSDLTFESMTNLIHEVIADKRMKEKSEEVSVLLRDQIRPVEEDVVYWMEYIIRHKGARHLRSPILDMTTVELYNIDVWALVFVLCVLGLIFDAWILMCCLRRCFGGSRSSKKKYE